MYLVKENHNGDIAYYSIRLENNCVVWDWLVDFDDKQEDLYFSSEYVSDENTCLDGRILSQFHIDHLFCWACRQI